MTTILRILLILSFVWILPGCKSQAQGASNCAVVMTGLDQCAAHRGNPQACNSAVEDLKMSLTATTINVFNQESWAQDCKLLCSRGVDYSPNVRQNFESICINSEVFNIRDDRFIKLAALASVWIVGCLVLLAGLFRTFRIWRVKRRAVSTRGTVVGHDSMSSDGDLLYAPIIEFTDWRGKQQRFTARLYTRSLGQPDYAVDSQVNVLYLRENPEQAWYDNAWSLWLVPGFLLVWGGGMALISGVALFGKDEWRGHNAYLQQHAPVIAEPVNQAVTFARDELFVLTSVRDYRVTDEQPDAIVIEADYLLSPFVDGDMYLGAITLTNGRSGGEWAYRPARLQRGFGRANVRLGMASTAPAAYCSNQIQLSIYEGGKGRIYQRVIPYEKCWSKQ
jgi:hypothetical protein